MNNISSFLFPDLFAEVYAQLPHLPSQVWHTHYTQFVGAQVRHFWIWIHNYLKMTGYQALVSSNKEGCLWDFEFKTLNTFFQILWPDCLQHKNKLKIK